MTEKDPILMKPGGDLEAHFPDEQDYGEPRNIVEVCFLTILFASLFFFFWS